MRKLWAFANEMRLPVLTFILPIPMFCRQKRPGRNHFLPNMSPAYPFTYPSTYFFKQIPATV
jgi:hypothetical protein